MQRIPQNDQCGEKGIGHNDDPHLKDACLNGFVRCSISCQSADQSRSKRKGQGDNQQTNRQGTAVEFANIIMDHTVVAAARTLPNDHNGRRAAALLGSCLVFLGTFGSILTLGREAVSQYQQFDETGIAVAAFVDENASADALFLTGTQHLNPVVSLAGRDIVCGSSLYVYYHGMDYAAQLQAVKELYEAPSEALLAQWGIDYVMISGWERSDYTVDEAFYAQYYPVWYQNGSYTIYQITEAS